MDKEKREDYIFEKKCLLILLYLYYRSDVPFDSLVLRSFGFHFDPSCNFKAIVRSKKEHIHKYVIHIFSSCSNDCLNNLDVMGNVNILKVPSVVKGDYLKPKASLNVYFDGNDFLADGFIEGQPICYCSYCQGPKAVNSADILYRLSTAKDSETLNSSAPTFLLWLIRFFTTKLSTDLVMGAGINRDYGAKDWNGLLITLSNEFYQGNEKEAEEVSHYVGKELFTSSMILKTSGFDTYKSLAHELYEFKEAKSFNDPDSTLYHCVDFLVKHPGTSVITYNYDTNLEYLFKKRDVRYCTIYDDNSFVDKDAVATIYHVHGLLPYGRADCQKFTDSLIFTETDYYFLYNNPYSWNIAKQLHDFKFNACIFIGISLTDPDMKRLLELANNYLKFNFIFLKREPDYSEKVFRDLTAYYFTFDLITIWVDDYDEIGTWLQAI
jgi:hypothetical protein